MRVYKCGWPLVRFLVVAACCLSMGVAGGADQPTVRIYVSGGGAPTISGYRLDPSNGALSLATTTEVGGSPNFLAWSPDQRMVYAVSSTADQDHVIVCRRDPITGALTRLEEVPTGGQGPCHVAVHPSGRWLYVAHYGSGQVSVLPISAEGRPTAPCQVIHAGSKAHMAITDVAGRFLFVPCLGDDAIKLFQIDSTTGRLIAHQPAAVAVPAGSGPRHLAFHPQGHAAYVINELAATVTSFAYDPISGNLTEPQTISALPGDYTGRKWAAHIVVAPDGRHLYASNRSHDSIAIFSIDPQRLRPILIGHETGQGELKTPRNFTLDPSGTLAFVASQDGDRLSWFRVNPANGLLTHLGVLPTSKGPSFVGVMLTP